MWIFGKNFIIVIIIEESILTKFILKLILEHALNVKNKNYLLKLINV